MWGIEREEVAMQAPQGRRWHRLLLVAPFVWQIGLVPWAGHVGYAPGRVPFLLLWMAAGVVVGSAAIAATYLIDRRAGGVERA